MTNTVHRAALAAAAVGLAGLGLAVRARASGASLRATVINDVLLPLSGVKRRARDAEALPRWIARHRQVEPARPSARLRGRVAIDEAIWRGETVFTVQPRSAASGATILYLHGGAWVFDVLAPHWWIVEALIARTGARVILPSYPLAPEHTWRETYAFVHQLLDEHLAADRGRLIVAGDSAGGCLAVGLAQRLRARNVQGPAGVILFSPALDLTFSDPRVRDTEPRDPMLAVAGCRAAARLWAVSTPLTDPRISPLFGPLDGLPPTAIFTGTRDILHPDALRLHAAMAHAGGTSTLHSYRGLCHVFVGAPIPEAEQALDAAAAFVRSCSGLGEGRAGAPMRADARQRPV